MKYFLYYLAHSSSSPLDRSVRALNWKSGLRILSQVAKRVAKCTLIFAIYTLLFSMSTTNQRFSTLPLPLSSRCPPSLSSSPAPISSPSPLPLSLFLSLPPSHPPPHCRRGGGGGGGRWVYKEVGEGKMSLQVI